VLLDCVIYCAFYSILFRGGRFFRSQCSLLYPILTTHHAVSDSALSWFQSYLHNRILNIFSVAAPLAGNTTADFVLDCSVPQQSVLGPLLFISYTAEVTDV